MRSQITFPNAIRMPPSELDNLSRRAPSVQPAILTLIALGVRREREKLWFIQTTS